MKPQTIPLFVFLILKLAQISNAQNIITERNGEIKYNSPFVYLSDDRIFYIDSISKTEISFPKKDLKSVAFSNGIYVSCNYSNVNIDVKRKYSCTINLRNGNFLTATIVRITGDSIIYNSPAGGVNLFIPTPEVFQINYLNSWRENFYLKESTVQNNISEYPKVNNRQPGPPKPENPKVTGYKTKEPEYKSSATLFVGATAGYVNSWTDNLGRNYSSENRKAFTSGFVACYEYIDYAAISFGLHFMPKGVRLSGDTINLKLNLSYLQLPLTFQVQTSDKKIKFFGEAGVSVGFLLSAKTIFTTPSAQTEKNVSPELQHLEFGILGGFGAKYFLKNSCLSVGLRYDMALTSIGGYTRYGSGSNTYFITGNANKNYNLYATYSVNIDKFKK